MSEIEDALRWTDEEGACLEAVILAKAYREQQARIVLLEAKLEEVKTHWARMTHDVHDDYERQFNRAEKAEDRIEKIKQELFHKDGELFNAINDATEWELENVTLQAEAKKFSERIAALEGALKYVTEYCNDPYVVASSKKALSGGSHE